jgi:cbb3-type cytochrome oxidase maturation protein
VTILYLLIPLGLLLLAFAVGAFFWATRSGQFDDLDAPAWRVVMDDDRAPPDHGEDSSVPSGKPEE